MSEPSTTSSSIFSSSRADFFVHCKTFQCTKIYFNLKSWRISLQNVEKRLGRPAPVRMRRAQLLWSVQEEKLAICEWNKTTVQIFSISSCTKRRAAPVWHVTRLLWACNTFVNTTSHLNILIQSFWIVFRSKISVWAFGIRHKPKVVVSVGSIFRLFDLVLRIPAERRSQPTTPFSRPQPLYSGLMPEKSVGNH